MMENGEFCPQEEFLAPAGQSREMGTCTANLGSSLIIVQSCPFFRSARTGTGCSSLSNEQEGAFRRSWNLLQVPQGSAAPLPQVQNCRVSQTPAVPWLISQFHIPNATNPISCARAAPSGSAVISLLYDLERRIWFFPHAQFCPHTSLLSPGKQLNIVFSQLSALNKACETC